MKKTILDIFKCPKCSTDLIIDSFVKKNKNLCKCGATFNIDDRLIDFNFKQKDWLGAALSKKEINEYLTDSDKKRMNIVHNQEKLLEALKTGLLELRNTYISYKPFITIDLCARLNLLYLNDKFSETLNEEIIVIIDSKEMTIRAIKEKLDKKNKKNFLFVICDPVNLPFKDNVISMIMTLAAFQNNPNSKEMFSEAIRVLGISGLMLDLAVFLEDSSRSLELADKLKGSDMLTNKRYIDYIKIFNNITFDTKVIANTDARFKTDLFPLLNDKSEIALISVNKKE